MDPKYLESNQGFLIPLHTLTNFEIRTNYQNERTISDKIFDTNSSFYVK